MSRFNQDSERLADLPFSRLIGWLECRCDGAWSIERLNTGVLRIEALSTYSGPVVAISERYDGDIVEQLNECFFELARKMGMEA